MNYEDVILTNDKKEQLIKKIEEKKYKKNLLKWKFELKMKWSEKFLKLTCYI